MDLVYDNAVPILEMFLPMNVVHIYTSQSLNHAKQTMQTNTAAKIHRVKALFSSSLQKYALMI